MSLPDIRDYLKPGLHAHLLGIGGVSMCPLAQVLKRSGMIVSGSDIQESSSVRLLRSCGIEVFLGHHAENIRGADLLIRTAAVRDDNREVVAARQQGIPVFERAQAWGCLMRSYRNAVCISGTHGKTTTTSMITHIAMAAETDPTVMIGGTLPLLGAGFRVGQGDTVILEACEYRDSFLSFYPTVSVLLNVEEDHLDYFENLDHLKRSFRAFAELTAPDGVIVANADDDGVTSALEGIERPVLTFGFDRPARVLGSNLTFSMGRPSFDVTVDGKLYAHITLQIPGRHNACNALAASAAAYALGLDGSVVERGLAHFVGAERRFQFKGTYNGADVYDDYAHHPSELRALLTMAESLGYQRIICAFQPHTYTRTKALFADFVRELRRPDITLLAEIYAAREKNEIGIFSSDLADQIPGAMVFPSLLELTEALQELASPGDLILTVGAGDIYTVGETLVASADR